MPTDQDKTIRKLRAILSADVKGYSLLMADDEVHTIQTLKAYRSLMSDLIQQHSGRVVDNPGDNLLAQFSSAVDAVECAVEVQKKLKKENAKFVEDKQLQFRIGVNIGDVVQDGDRIYGCGVNVAARIEGLADPGGICVSRNTYDHVKDKLDLGHEYLGEHEVKNIKDPVRVYRVLLDSDAPKALVDEPLELPDNPSIAVLPFDNMSKDPDQEYFSDGLTEQIINGLCKVSNLFVIARNSSFAYKGRATSIKQIAQELGVKYILEGSVQRSRDRVRITAQLIDATTDYHMWSETYDRNLEDIFALQDEITMKLIGAMQVQLTLGEQAHSWGTRTNISAFDHCMRGMEYLYRLSKRDVQHSREILNEAIRFDSAYALPYVLTGFSHICDLAFGWSKSPLRSFEQAEIFVEKALTLNNSLDLAHGLLGWINLFKRQYDEAIKEGERAVELNPNGAESLAQLAFTLTYVGEANKAVRLMKRAFRLNPIPPAHFYAWMGMAYESDGQYEKAIELCKKAIGFNPQLYGSYFPLIYSCMSINRIEDAYAYVDSFLKVAPKFSLNLFKSIEPFKNPKRAEKYINALRKAGLPD
jgi:adenylate cyclase